MYKTVLELKYFLVCKLQHGENKCKYTSNNLIPFQNNVFIMVLTAVGEKVHYTAL